MMGLTATLLLVALAQTGARPAADPAAGRALYLQRCAWCHGDEGRGDGASAVGMFPRPRDFVRAAYKIRSTPHGQLPTDDDLFRSIARGLPGTPMPAWEKVLSDEERWRLVDYLKSLSPRFGKERAEPIVPPSGAGSTERGREVYRAAKCFLCHGNDGRADGQITTTLNFEWGIPHTARDFTRGWTFKGGHDPRDIYLRITGGLNGTPMGAYADLLTDAERWDLAHYVASLDDEPAATTDDFLVTATRIEGPLPDEPDGAAWSRARPVTVPLAGQVVQAPPLRWWIPTSGSCTVRALHDDRDVAVLVDWNDPTSGSQGWPDSAFLQFPSKAAARPYFLLGDGDNPVVAWHWQEGGPIERWDALGSRRVSISPADFRAQGAWRDGRWRVVWRRPIAGEPFVPVGGFLPIVVSVRDGANAEAGDVRATSTWFYLTLERPSTSRPWLIGLASLLAAAIAEAWIVRKLRP